MRSWWRYMETKQPRIKVSASIFLCSGIANWGVQEISPWTKAPNKISHELHLSPEVGIALDFFLGVTSVVLFTLVGCFSEVSRVAEIWHPEPNTPEWHVQFPQRRSKRAQRKGVSKVSLQLRANKNETILFWDLINFYIQSYAHVCALLMTRTKKIYVPGNQAFF